MQLLALETSTDYGTCALWRDGQVIERACPTGRPHSETLLPLVGAMLAEAGVNLRSLDAVAFAAGPGAFTGLRIACGIAQGLAVGADLPVVPVGTLDTLAADCAGDRVITLLDARMNEVYGACFERREGQLAPTGEIVVAAPETVWLPDGGGWVAVGNALSAYPVLAARVAAAGWLQLPKALPRAARVAELAAVAVAAGHTVDAALAAPVYVRDKVARTVAERLAAGGASVTLTAKIVSDPEFLPMTERDLDAVTALEASVQGFPWSRGNFADSLTAGYSAWVCRVGGDLAGFSIVMPVMDEAHLLNIAVCKRHQGRGIGARLLQRAMQNARSGGANRLFLEVRRSNAQAVRLYRDFGFAEIAVRKGYYPAVIGREDALVFERAL